MSRRPGPLYEARPTLAKEAADMRSIPLAALVFLLSACTQSGTVQVQLTGAKRVARGGTYDLWRPAGTPRFSLFSGGLYYDHWLAERMAGRPCTTESAYCDTVKRS